MIESTEKVLMGFSSDLSIVFENPIRTNRYEIRKKIRKIRRQLEEAEKMRKLQERRENLKPEVAVKIIQRAWRRHIDCQVLGGSPYFPGVREPQNWTDACHLMTTTVTYSGKCVLSLLNSESEFH